MVALIPDDRPARNADGYGILPSRWISLKASRIKTIRPDRLVAVGEAERQRFPLAGVDVVGAGVPIVR